MLKNFLHKLKESFFAVFPITAIIFLSFLIFVPSSVDLMVKVLISFFMLLVGMALFNMGADNSMVELGEGVGSTLSKSKKIWMMLIFSFVIGFIITFAEPDLAVLAKQVQEFSSLSSSWIFITFVSIGVGISMLLAVFKLIFKIKLSYILTFVYVLIFVLAFFAPQEFVPISFDSGSVTTGPISVPFLITFGLGLCAVRSGKNEDESFGFIALCSAGPILSVMILSLFLETSETTMVESVSNLSVFESLIQCLGTYVKDVALTILPIVVLFFLFQFFAFKYPKTKVVKMLIGFLFTYVGIVLFLTGVELGFMTCGKVIGSALKNLDNKVIVVLFGGILGVFAVLAEPALHVLKKQVEDITGGVIKQRVIVVVMCMGVALSVMCAILQTIFEINILFILIPIYAICLILGFVNSNLFTAVAFDSGGVATGAMAVSFILPLVISLSNANSSGFGTVALIAIFPVLTMQILGFVFKLSVLKQNKHLLFRKHKTVKIVEFDYIFGDE